MASQRHLLPKCSAPCLLNTAPLGGLHTLTAERMRQTCCHLLYNIEKNYQSFSFVTHHCEQKRLRSDGTSIIYFQFFHDGEHRTFLNTEIKIPPEYWDKKRLCIKDNLPEE